MQSSFEFDSETEYKGMRQSHASGFLVEEEEQKNFDPQSTGRQDSKDVTTITVLLDRVVFVDCEFNVHHSLRDFRLMVGLPQDASFEKKNRNRVSADEEVSFRVKDVLQGYAIFAKTDGVEASQAAARKRGRIIFCVNGKPQKPVNCSGEATLHEFRAQNQIARNISFLDQANGQVLDNEEDWQI